VADVGGGEVADFELRLNEPPQDSDPVAFRTDFDPEDPAGVIVRVAGRFTPSTQLYYGGGLKPYCNIMDDAGMMIPALGPVNLVAEQG